METKNFFSKLTVLYYILPLIFTACSNAVDIDQNEDAGQSGLPSFNRIDGGRLVALATCRLFDAQKSTTKSSALNAETVKNLPQTRASEASAESFRIKYGFDCVEILGGIRYTVKNADIPLINDVCGTGETDVILTSFVTYIYSDNDGLQPVVDDALIVFRSEQGIYACMLNSGGEYAVYSSHKRFEQSAIVKDFTPPVYEFYLKNEKGTSLLSGSIIIAEDGSSQKKTNLTWFPLQEQESISENSLFSIDELTSASQIEQPCTITETGGKYFLVNSDSNLKKICFDEYTEMYNGIAAGDKVTVTFDKLYEKYNPQVVFANKVMKKL